MSHLRTSYRSKITHTGFTLVEVLTVIVIVGIVSTAFFTFFNDSVSQYLSLQRDGMEFSDLAAQSQRISQVIRGLTDITSASSSDLVIYAYFYPNDAYVSLVHYYKNAAGTTLYADVTPMTANPPIGTPITANMKTYTIIPDFATVSGVNLFDYLDANGSVLAMPISDLHIIKGVKVNLAVPSKAGASTGNAALSVSVSLRNRKTNL